MQLYKLRLMDGEGFYYALDMMTNERIFLSTCEYMNDVNEGMWEIIGACDSKYMEVAEKLRELIDGQRFSCFLDRIDSPLMWAHYAGGFRGIAFEYGLDETKYDIRKIDYTGVPKVTKAQVERVLSGELRLQGIGLLKQKERYWEYEGEWRLYGNNSDAYINIKPQSIIF